MFVNSKGMWTFVLISPSECADVIQNSLSHRWLEAVLAQMQQNKPKPWYSHKGEAFSCLEDTLGPIDTLY